MDTTDNALAIGGLTILIFMAGCTLAYVLRQTCINKDEALLNNGDDGVSEVYSSS